MATIYVTPYLFFDGDCREAMEFYQKVFGGKLSVMTYGDSDPTASEDLKNKVMHANIMEGPVELMAGDSPDGSELGSGNVQVTLHGTDEARLTEMFEALSEGGEVVTPLERQMWGDLYGALTDRVGIRGMVNISPEKS